MRNDWQKQERQARGNSRQIKAWRLRETCGTHGRLGCGPLAFQTSLGTMESLGGAEERLGSQVLVAEEPGGHHCPVCRGELAVAVWTLGVRRGSAAVCVDPGRLPSSLGLFTESAKGSFESAKESTYPCQGGKGSDGRLEGWLMGAGRKENVGELGRGRVT